MPPLDQVRILITRTRTQASELAAQLESLGAQTILIPTIEIAPPTSYCALDAALATLRTFDWLLFTSANAVDCFIARARQQGITPTPNRIAAIGPATARAVERHNLTVDLIPPHYVAESLAEALIHQAIPPTQSTPASTPETSGTPHRPSFLLVRAEEARDILPDNLTAAGATVTIAPAYRNQTPPDAIPALKTLFATPSTTPHIITFTSSSTARNLLTLLESATIELPPTTILASIGPITSQTLRDLNLPPTLEATEPTVASLTEAIATHFSSKEDHYLLTPEERNLLAWNVINEITNGFLVPDFESSIGGTENEMRNLGLRLRAAANDEVVAITAAEAMLLRNALSLALRELGEEEFQTRTGDEFQFGLATVERLNWFLRATI